MTQITILDGYTLNPGDINWAPVEALGQTTIYDRSTPSDLPERAKDADILVINKFVLSREMINQLPKLSYIAVSATGYNNVDIQAAKEKGIPVSNVAGYSTNAVAQHVFSLILAFSNRVSEHNQAVHAGQWSASPDFTFSHYPIMELKDKTLGIYGFGSIGQEVAKIGQAFGMNILATHKHPQRDAREGVRFVNLEELFEQSDVISMHAPLTEQTAGIVNLALLQKMKRSAYLINTSRGGLINESDLKAALEQGKLAGAALDVLSAEPPLPNHPLIGIENCLITPHQAWASREARSRLMFMLADNIRSFLAGEAHNIVNL